MILARSTGEIILILSGIGLGGFMVGIGLVVGNLGARMLSRMFREDNNEH